MPLLRKVKMTKELRKLADYSASKEGFKKFKKSLDEAEKANNEFDESCHARFHGEEPPPITSKD